LTLKAGLEGKIQPNTRNPFQLEELWETSYFGAGVREFGSRGIGVVALSGVDIALWDIEGKARNIPVFELLGGACRERVEVYATALYPEEPAGVVEKAVGFAEKGFRGVNGHGAALYV